MENSSCFFYFISLVSGPVSNDEMKTTYSKGFGLPMLPAPEVKGSVVTQIRLRQTRLLRRICFSSGSSCLITPLPFYIYDFLCSLPVVMWNKHASLWFIIFVRVSERGMQEGFSGRDISSAMINLSVRYLFLAQALPSDIGFKVEGWTVRLVLTIYTWLCQLVTCSGQDDASSCSSPPFGTTGHD